MTRALMTRIARLFGLARPVRDDTCLEQRRAVARARARALVQSIAASRPEARRR